QRPSRSAGRPIRAGCRPRGSGRGRAYPGPVPAPATDVARSDQDRAVSMATAAAEPLVSMHAISKKYANVVALSGVDMTLRSGEIVALVGDNGAGKSTLIKVLSGAVRPDSGEIDMEGKPIRITKPSDAQHLGIAAIYQDLALFNNLDA